jgi:hypothetical protein
LDVPALVGIGIAASVSTNIDDLFTYGILCYTQIPFISNRSWTVYRNGIVNGCQFSRLTYCSCITSISHRSDRIIPYCRGNQGILEPHKLDSREDNEKLFKRLRAKKIQLPVLKVAAATFSGGEEIGIYTALFATDNEM